MHEWTVKIINAEIKNVETKYYNVVTVYRSKIMGEKEHFITLNLKYSKARSMTAVATMLWNTSY